jgi:hypothetical protein
MRHKKIAPAQTRRVPAHVASPSEDVHQSRRHGAYPTARAASQAALPIWLRSSGVSPTAGDSSSTCWHRVGRKALKARRRCVRTSGNDPVAYATARNHIRAGTGLIPAASALGLGSTVPHLHRDGSFLPHLHRDWACHCHICAGTGLTLATSAPGLGSPLPYLRRE